MKPLQGSVIVGLATILAAVSSGCGGEEAPAAKDELSASSSAVVTYDPKVHWSTSGPIAGEYCTQINEPSDPHGWDNNYLCTPISNYGFKWSSSGPIAGMSCIAINETADPDGWSDNYLCVSSMNTPYMSKMEFSSYLVNGMPAAQYYDGATCVSMNEPEDPDSWSDNYLCFVPPGYACTGSKPYCCGGFYNSYGRCLRPCSSSICYW